MFFLFAHVDYFLALIYADLKLFLNQEGIYIERTLRWYTEACDGVNKLLEALFFLGFVALFFYLGKNPEFIGYATAYAISGIILMVGKLLIDQWLKEQYLSRYDRDYRMHIYLNRGGWEKEADKAFRISNWEILAAIWQAVRIKIKEFFD